MFRKILQTFLKWKKKFLSIGMILKPLSNNLKRLKIYLSLPSMMVLHLQLGHLIMDISVQALLKMSSLVMHPWMDTMSKEGLVGIVMDFL